MLFLEAKDERLRLRPDGEKISGVAGSGVHEG